MLMGGKAFTALGIILNLLYIPSSYLSAGMIKRLFLLMVPLVASQVASFGIMTSDIIMMGQLSVADLASGSLAIRYYQPFYFFTLGLTAVTAPLIAQAIGAGDPQAARRAFRQGLVIVFILSLITMPLVAYGAPVLTFLGQGADVAARAEPFYFGPL